MIHSKAEEFTEKLEINDFKTNTGWFEGFIDRNYIIFRRSVMKVDQ